VSWQQQVQQQLALQERARRNELEAAKSKKQRSDLEYQVDCHLERVSITCFTSINRAFKLT
jgi:hypothetical protein